MVDKSLLEDRPQDPTTLHRSHVQPPTPQARSTEKWREPLFLHTDAFKDMSGAEFNSIALMAFTMFTEK